MRLATVFGLLALALLPAAALAAVVLRADVEALAQKSDRAVEGTVREQAVLYDRTRGRIWTRHRIEVARTLVGDAAEELLVHVPGGRVGDIEQRAHGAARLEEGSRVVLFLWSDEDDRLRVLGQAQGCFRIRRDARTGETLASNDVAGLTLVDTGMRPVEGRRTQLRIEDLRRRVRAARRALEEAQRRRAEARASRLAELRRKAEQNEERTRGRPGGAQ